MVRKVNWSMKCQTFSNCNFDVGRAVQLRRPGNRCQFVEAGYLVDGHFSETPLAGLNWVFVGTWPGDMAAGNGREMIAIDERANYDQREALRQILLGEVGEPGSNHFSVVNGWCNEVLEPIFAPIHFEIDVEACRANLEVLNLLKAKGEPAETSVETEPYHIALTRPACGLEFTYEEIGSGTASVSGQLAMELPTAQAQFCVHHYDQDGLVSA